MSQLTEIPSGNAKLVWGWFGFIHKCPLLSVPTIAAGIGYNIKARQKKKKGKEVYD